MSTNESQIYRDPPFFKLDNAATMYAAADTKYWSRTYRTAFILDRDIDGALLRQAVNETAKRLPTFSAIKRDGFFWNYFEKNSNQPVVLEESDYPYRPIPTLDTKDSCFRILYYKRRIALEAFHSVSDGGGTDVLLKTIVGRYLELCGEKVEHSDGVLDVFDSPKASEANDDYYRYADRTAKAKNAQAIEVYHSENQPISGYANIIHGLFPVEAVSRVAKEKGLTITEYLTALLIFMFYSCPDGPVDKPISISVPIDLRPRFSSDSVRNFVFMTDVSFDAQGRTDCTFEEICDSIRGKLKEKASKEILRASISSNVAAQSSPVLKIVPYPIKRAFLKKTYKKVQLSYTVFFSNLGEFKFPKGMKEHIVRVESVLGDSPYLHFGCTAASCNGIFNFTFSSGNTNMDKQKFFFRFLSSQGIPVRIESNDSFSEATMPEVNAL